MPRKGHTDEPIIRALSENEGGKKVADICREFGISQQAFYGWKRRYAGWFKGYDRAKGLSERPPVARRGASPDALETELQKTYDSEINVTIRMGPETSLSLLTFDGSTAALTGTDRPEHLGVAAIIAGYSDTLNVQPQLG